MTGGSSRRDDELGGATRPPGEGPEILHFRAFALILTAAAALITVGGHGDAAHTSFGVVGTDPNDYCGPSAWPPHFDDNQEVNIVDVVALKPAFGQPVAGNET